MNAKRQNYAVKMDDLSTTGCEVLFLCPKTVHQEPLAPPLEELERIREGVARAARIFRGTEKVRRI
jgi:hypothetical protein